MKASLLLLAVLAVLPFAGCGKGRDDTGQDTARKEKSQRMEEGGRGGIVFIGIDGASWNVMMPLVNAGKLPNIRKLMMNGAWGSLRSERPTLSPAIWTTMATGVGREEHGISGFAEKVPGKYESVYMTSSSRKVPALWNIFSSNGKSVGVVNWWASWPAEEVDGFNLSNYVFLTPVTEKDDNIATSLHDAVYPAEIADEVNSGRKPAGKLLDGELLAVFGTSDRVKGFTRRGASSDLDPKSEEYQMGLRKYTIQKQIETELGETEVAGRLYNDFKPNLFMVYYEGIDMASHLWWKYHESVSLAGAHDVSDEDRAKYGEVLSKYYEFTDRMVGRLMEDVGEGATVVIASDHGFKAKPPFDFTNIFRLNRLFARLGYLKYADEVKEEIDYSKSKLIDFNQSDFWSSSRMLYVNLKGREETGTVNPGSEYDAFVKQTISRLAAIKTVSGKPLFVRVYVPGAEAGADRNTRPDIVAMVNGSIEPGDIISLEGNNHPVTDFMVPKPVSGDHDIDGILIVSGPDVKKKTVIQDADIYDVVPTVLYAGGVPVLSSMRGKILTGIFRDDYVKVNPPGYIDEYKIEKARSGKGKAAPSQADKELRERLKSLGYVQ